MPQSLARILVHVVFSTKNREPVLSPEIRPHLFGYLATVGRDLGCEVFRVGGVADHVHLAIDLGRTVTIANFVQKVKQTSSGWLKEQEGGPRHFEWQTGYGSFSVGQSQLEALLNYVSNQEEHHRKITFQDEYRALLKKYGVDVDERYVWE
ncbi:IS200/IS605 family transposase [Luteolibacter arcticus]|uniref:IS200/IS605 family transposase n=1 Tax=Luteolibacter arcticus TaxID=1581411 RepID=A0ABT3GGH8_9BACT|nr:IS200/IS605 family transposase [Luteolibacter arcticus]MCW1922720.1 IS200/IS605 family transposase [Luteolibacter arcticus]